MPPVSKGGTELRMYHMAARRDYRPSEAEAVQEYPVPKNKNVLCFLHVCTQYRRFTDRYADIAKPLTQLMKRNRLSMSELKKQKLLSSP